MQTVYIISHCICSLLDHKWILFLALPCLSMRLRSPIPHMIMLHLEFSRSTFTKKSPQGGDIQCLLIQLPSFILSVRNWICRRGQEDWNWSTQSRKSQSSKSEWVLRCNSVSTMQKTSRTKYTISWWTIVSVILRPWVSVTYLGWYFWNKVMGMLPNWIVKIFQIKTLSVLLYLQIMLQIFFNSK